MKKNILTVAVAGVALVLAASGGAVAGDLITGKDIKDGSIKTKDIAPGAVKKLAGDDGADGKDGAQGPAGKDGTDGLLGAKYRTLTYLNGGGGSATVACADDATESQKYTAIAGGVQGSESGVSETQSGFLVSSSFPGRMNWDTGKPKPGRLDGWIVFGNSQHTSTLTVWALCVPTNSIAVDAGTLDN